jgi:putative ABC transport system permease protein
VVVAEVAPCFVLLVGSGLMFRSFLALQRIDPGFDTRGLLTFRQMGGKSGPTPESRAAVMRQMHAAMAAVPGVQRATARDILPLTSAYFPYRWGHEDALADPTKFQAADVETVLPGYFGAMHTSLIAGREFTESDNNQQVRRMVIDQVLAAKAFPNTNAVGQRILSRSARPSPSGSRSSASSRTSASLLSPIPAASRPLFPMATGAAASCPSRPCASRAIPHATRPHSRRHGEIRPHMLLTRVETMDSIVGRAQTGTRFSLLLIATFAFIAALLAGVGLYGVLSTVVRQRTAEIGVRMALGAAPSGVFSLMIAYGLRLSAAGSLPAWWPRCS